jgi:transposase
LKKKSLLSLGTKEFACEPDAISAAIDFEKTLKYHSLTELNIVAKPHYKRKGRPRPEDVVSRYTYHIQAHLVEDEAVIQTYQHQSGRFILATNLLDDKKWTADLILQEYKAQQTTERGFRFIKDPLFFASRVFLKSTKRIMALTMIMTLALMVYSERTTSTSTGIRKYKGYSSQPKRQTYCPSYFKVDSSMFSICSSCLCQWR